MSTAPSGPPAPAVAPWRLPAGSWKAVLARTKDEIKTDRAPLLAAGVAFYALISLVPALVAVLSVYGLVRDPDEARREILDFTDPLPESVAGLLEDQLLNVVDSSGGGLGLGVALGILGALWSASSATKHVIESLNAAYDETETRGFLAMRGVSLGITLITVLVIAGGIVGIVALPSILAELSLGAAAETLLSVGRYPLVGFLFLVALAVLYRYGPNRQEPSWQLASPGAVVATVVWVLASLAFSVYVSNFGSYDETYGSLGAVVVLALWLFITAFCVVLGAELNSELEHQVALDADAHSVITGPPDSVPGSEGSGVDVAAPEEVDLRDAVTVMGLAVRNGLVHGGLRVLDSVHSAVTRSGHRAGADTAGTDRAADLTPQ